jgi:hypothetical protein
MIKKYLSLVLVIVNLSILSTACTVYAEVRFQGLVLLSNGDKIQCTNITLFSHERYESIGTAGGWRLKPINGSKEVNFEMYKINKNQKINIDMRKIKSISCIERNVYEIGLKNGNKAVLISERTENNLLSKTLRVEYKDTFTNSIQNEKLKFGKKRNSPNVVSILFEGNGDVKWSKSSERYFPAGYNYDPYTGEKLELRNSSN